MPESTVYLLEDSESDAFALRRALTRIRPGVQVVHWHRAEEALDAIKSGRSPAPDLWFVDLQLPGWTGLDFLERLNHHPVWSAVPAVVLTSSEAPEAVTASYLAGARGHLVKQSCFQQFTKTLEGCLKYWFETSALPRFAGTSA